MSLKEQIVPTPGRVGNDQATVKVKYGFELFEQSDLDELSSENDFYIFIAFLFLSESHIEAVFADAMRHNELEAALKKEFGDYIDFKHGQAFTRNGAISLINFVNIPGKTRKEVKQFVSFFLSKINPSFFRSLVAIKAHGESLFLYDSDNNILHNPKPINEG